MRYNVSNSLDTELSKRANTLNQLMKFLTYLLALGTICATLTSCIEDRGFTQSFIVNTTDHKLTMLLYRSDTIDTQKTVVINAHSEILVLNTSGGVGTAEPCYNTTADSYDSVVFVYDVSVKIAHLHERFTAYPHSIPYPSSRSIMNPDNYIKEVTSESKHRSDGNCRFIVTEQDYLDAL